MANYTTVDAVRSESGFENNEIADAFIETAIKRANSEINSAIAARYSLPLSNNNCWENSPGKGLLESIELLLASGYLLIQEYGVDAVNSDKDGYHKRDIAKKQIQEIIEGTLKLICENWQEFIKWNKSNAGTLGIKWTPKDTKRHFSINDNF